MRYFDKMDYNKPCLTGAKLLRVEREKLNPLPGLTFVSIAYYQLPDTEIIGIVW